MTSIAITFTCIKCINKDESSILVTKVEKALIVKTLQISKISLDSKVLDSK